MTRTHIVALMAVIVAVPAAGASSFFATKTVTKPCFNAGRAGYEFSSSASATHTVRIDNTAKNPLLRLQLVDNPAQADFVLVDDTDAANSCAGVTAIQSIHVDPAAIKPNLTVALSRAPAEYKIYVHSTAYSEQDAAALFAVIWQNANATGSIGKSASRN